MKSFYALLVFFSCIFVAVIPVLADCTPSELTRNPKPVIVPGNKAAAAATADCESGGRNRYQNGVEIKYTLDLKKGTHWMAASGCPRVNTIAFVITDPNGKVIKKSNGYDPSACFTVPADARYTLGITAKTVSSSTWGNVKYCVSRSGCKN